MNRPVARFADLLLMYRRLRPEVETAQVTDRRELRQLHSHGDPSFVLARDLPCTQEAQGIAQVQLAARRLVQEGVQLIPDRVETQAGQHLRQRIHRFVAPHHPPPTISAYASRGRRRLSERDPSGSRVLRTA